MSEQWKHPNLAAAMAAAQAVMGDVPKSGVNPAFKTPDHKDGRPYSTLCDVINSIRGPLTSNGLSWSQKPTRVGGVVKVTTIIKHESGESDESELEIPCEDKAAQKIGTAISYARRYSLMAMCGLASEDDDDDGNALSLPVPEEPRTRDRRVNPAVNSAAIGPPPRHYSDAELKRLRHDCQRLVDLAKPLLDRKATELRTDAGLPAEATLSGQQLAGYRKWLIESIDVRGGVVPEWARDWDPLDQRVPGETFEP